MSRVVVISILIVALLFAAVWLAGLPDSEGDTDPVVQQPQQSPADTAYQNGADEPVGVVATDAENEIDASACDFRQLRTLQQFNRENLQRLEPSILSPETVSSYRGLSVHDLSCRR